MLGCFQFADSIQVIYINPPSFKETFRTRGADANLNECGVSQCDAGVAGVTRGDAMQRPASGRLASLFLGHGRHESLTTSMVASIVNTTVSIVVSHILTLYKVTLIK